MIRRTNGFIQVFEWLQGANLNLNETQMKAASE